MATGAGQGGNVLSALDERTPSSFYWQLTVLATLGGFLFGYDTSNIGSALNFVRVQFPWSDAQPVAGMTWLR